MAWADGALRNSEKRMLDTHLHELPDLSERDYAMYRLYMEYPITEAEEGAILAEFSAACTSSEARNSSINTISKMVQADGQVDARALELYDKIIEHLHRPKGVLGKLSGSSSKLKAPQREAELDRYIENPLLFLLKKQAGNIDIQEVGNLEELEYLTSFGAIITAIIQTEKNVSASAVEALANVLSARWHVSLATATAIAEFILQRYVTKEEASGYCHHFRGEHGEEDVLELYSLLLDVMKTSRSDLLKGNEMLRFIATKLGIDSALVEESIKAINPAIKKV